jgi:hypothetical protein
LRFSLPARFLCSYQTCCFLGLTASLFISTALGLCFGKAASLFSRDSLRFFFRAMASRFFGQPARFFFGLTSLLGFRTHLRFDLRPQARFVFRPAQRVSFRPAARIFFGAMARGFFGHSLRIFSGALASSFASLHAFNFFFNRAEPHFGTPAQLIFLGFLPGFCFQIASLFCGAMDRVLFFGLAQGSQFTFMDLLCRQPLSLDFSSAAFLHCAHASQVFFRALQFLLGDLAAMVFGSLFPGLDFDSLLFLLRAMTRRLFFNLTPTFLLGS